MIFRNANTVNRTTWCHTFNSECFLSKVNGSWILQETLLLSSSQFHQLKGKDKPPSPSCFSKLLLSYLRQRAAGPGSAQSLAAGGRPGTRCRLVALGVAAGQREGGHLAEPGRDSASCSLVTCGGGQVADGAMRTAVQMVIATHRLEDRRRYCSHQPNHIRL